MPSYAAFSFHWLFTAMTCFPAAVHVEGIFLATVSNETVHLEYEAFRVARRLDGPGSQLYKDSVSQEERLGRFRQYREMVESHNARPDVSCKLEVNRFADYTEEELRSTLGYQRTGSWQTVGGGSSFFEANGDGDRDRLRIENVAENFDWSAKLPVSSGRGFVRDQGHCGSCWAVATVGALELHAELGGSVPRRLSFKQIVNCMPNEQHCGGDGGCKGATGELAFDWVTQNGLASETEYQGKYGDKCVTKPSTTTSAGFRRLPTNKYLELLKTVADVGPVVTSVAAIPQFHAYSEGVFNLCPRDTVVDHAMVIVGYGVDANGLMFWTLRNSWAERWGEGGYMRIVRHSEDTGSAGHCGWDDKPEEGVGCAGGPKEIYVCGMCGILSDNSYPLKVRTV